ncbi:MAG: glycogen-binding domain-containing protein [Candidatus Krumholzibacteria bacterium]|nr:glycogen-binding domain-containing protein [Candidatus Krumholzibacteria bacterium]
MKRFERICPIFSVLAIVAALSCCGTMGGPAGSVEPTSGPQVTAEGVRFSLFSTKVKSACVAGSFNNWSMTADPLHDREGTGMWSVTIPLPPGRYEYKFVIDGEEWIPDPANPTTADDGFGGSNSVITVGE